jgi:hypothetical protein
MIKSAAIEFNGVVYTGRSHPEIGLQMLRDKICPRPYPGGKHQGFVTDQGEFVDRETALQIAIDCKQVEEGKTSHHSELFSEDLRKEL